MRWMIGVTSFSKRWLSVGIIGAAVFWCGGALGQERRVGQEAAAYVNGQPIPEVTVQRGLKRVPADKHAEARAQILDYLITNVLLDQYLQQLGVEISNKEVESRMTQIRDEVSKSGQPFDKVVQEMQLSPDELRDQMAAELRWDKFIAEKATDPVLQNLFNKHLDMFDGSMVRARHILLKPAGPDPQALEDTKARLQHMKEQIEAEAAKVVAKLPADADAARRETVRARATDDAFALLAAKESSCPSKTQGGDLGWFPRSGSMIEAFARAAFALKPFQLSDIVTTPFGVHLILVTERRAGRETKFEDVKDVVKEVYSDRLREVLAVDLRPKAKIVFPAR